MPTDSASLNTGCASLPPQERHLAAGPGQAPLQRSCSDWVADPEEGAALARGWPGGALALPSPEPPVLPPQNPGPELVGSCLRAVRGGPLLGRGCSEDDMGRVLALLSG